MSSVELEMAAEAEEAWAGFRKRLADRIAELDDDEVVTVELESGIEEDELAGAAPYLQLIGWCEDLVRAEVSSNHYLDKRYALAVSDEERLGELGWLSPTYAPDEEADEGAANFHCDLERREADRVAVLSVRTLREVFGCRHPVFLVTDGLITEADEDELWAEIEAEAESAAAARPDPDEPLAVFPESSEQLQELVDRALAPASNEPLRHDEDGDIVVVQGRSVVFVRISDSHPAVDLYCEMVHDIRDVERAQLVRLRTGADDPAGHDLELALAQLRAALRFVAEVEALPAIRRTVPARPPRTQQLSLLAEDEATLEDSLWARDLEESS